MKQIVADSFLFFKCEVKQMDDHKKAMDILADVRQKVADYAKQMLSNSVRSGSTPSNERYLFILNQYHQTLMISHQDLSETDKNIVNNGVSNFTKTTLAASYTISVQGNKREIDGKMPPEVTDKFVADNTKTLGDIRSKLQSAMTQLMADSIRTGNTPSKEQTIGYLRVTADDLIADSGADEQSTAYLKNYVTPWIKDTLGNVYDYSLKISPRAVNKRLPWTPADAKVDEPTKTNPTQKNSLSEYQKTYNSFSGHDMVCSVAITMPNGKKTVKVIGSLQTITYSVHQDRRPVRAIGNMNAKDYVFGQRTIAGTLIFTVFNKHWAYDIMDEYKKAGDLGSIHFLMDELPPFDITISAANEYGFTARLAVYGVRIINEGQVMSINDVYTENTYQFVATDLDYLTDCTGFISQKSIKAPNLPPTNSTPLPSKPNVPTVPTTEDTEVVIVPTPDTTVPVDPPKPTVEPAPVDPYVGKTEEQVLSEIESNKAADMATVDANLAAGKYKGGANEANRIKVAYTAVYNAKAEEAKKYFDAKKSGG